MANELRELLHVLADLIGKMPDTALYILLGFFIFKITALVVPAWGLISVIKLAINKIHDAKVKPIERTIRVSLDGMFITHDGTYNYFKDVISRVINSRTNSKITNYIHRQDVEWLAEAIDEKQRREKDSNN